MSSLFYIFVALSDLAFFLLMLGFHLRRKDPIIQERAWPFSMCIAFFGLLHFHLMSVEHERAVAGEPVSCHILIWSSIIFIPMYCLPFFMRSSYTIFQFYAQLEKGRETMGFFWKHRLYASVKFNMLVYLFFGLLQLVIGFLLQFTTPDPENYFSTEYNCLTKQFYLIVVQLVLMVLIAIFVIIKIWKVHDPYYIKLELKVTIVLCLPLAILWVVEKLVGYLPTTFNSAFLIMGIIYGGFISSFALPIAMSLKQDRLKRSPTGSSFSSNDVDRLCAILQDPPLYESFKEMCQNAWCVETLIFFKKATEFRERFFDMTPEQHAKLASEIFETHIKVGSTLQVNLDMSTRETITEKIQNGVLNDVIFEEARKAVFALMKYGVYRDFMRTPQFRKRFPETDKSLENLELTEKIQNV